MSNLKQIGLGLKQYSQDYDGKYPEKSTVLGNSFLRGADDPQSLPFVLDVYIKSKQIWVCPSGWENLQMAGNTYAYYPGSSASNNPDANEGDGNQFDVSVVTDAYFYKSVSTPGVVGNPTAQVKANRHCPHFERYNQLYFDGHVKLRDAKTAATGCPAS